MTRDGGSTCGDGAKATNNASASVRESVFDSEPESEEPLPELDSEELAMRWSSGPRTALPGGEALARG